MRSKETLFKNALRRSYQLQKSMREEFYNKMREGDRYTHSQFRYFLAQELAYLLQNNISGRIAIYVYGSTISDSAYLASDLDLLFLVEEVDKSLKEWINDLDILLCQDYNAFLGQRYLERMLNVSWINQSQHKNREGKSVLINSPFHPALRIWPEYGRGGMTLELN